MITTMQKNTQIEDYLDDKISEVHYAYINGKMVEVPLDYPKCIAKSIKVDNPNLKSLRHFILVGQDRSLYNPTEPLQRGIEDKVSGHLYWNFDKVSDKVFDMYLTYFRTQNKHYFRTASKLYRDGE